MVFPSRFEAADPVVEDFPAEAVPRLSELLPGYTIARAAESDRRQKAGAIVLEMVEDKTPAGDMHWVTVAPEGDDG
jgi:hypothetical protein